MMAARRLRQRAAAFLLLLLGLAQLGHAFYIPGISPTDYLVRPVFAP